MISKKNYFISRQKNMRNPCYWLKDFVVRKLYLLVDMVFSESTSGYSSYRMKIAILLLHAIRKYHFLLIDLLNCFTTSKIFLDTFRSPLKINSLC